MKLTPVLAGVMILGVGAVVGQFSATADGSRGGVAGGIGADITHSNIQDVVGYTPVGGIRAYAIGSWTCNMGDSSLSWINNGTPGLAMNAYRLHEGRIMQIGQSWAKTACCVANGSGCGITCSGSGFGLRPGCRDVYSASWNGGQGRLSPRSGINAYAGTFPTIPGGSFTSISRRLQIAETDLVTASFPGALYFVEGVYVATEDAQNANTANNATYRQVLVGGTFTLTVTGSSSIGQSALNAWRDHGLGVGVADPSVQLVVVDVPSEGRFHAGSKVRDLGGGVWRYEYAVFNLNSHRSGGSFSVPIPAGAIVTNVGFHDVPYHSGEPFDNTDWSSSVAPGSVTWSSPATFAADPNSNALRWGTMYNFWFDANVAPTSGQATLGLFRPGTPNAVLVPGRVPRAASDIDGDGHVGPIDLAELLAGWGPCAADVACPADVTGDGIVDGLDLGMLLAAWTGQT